MCVCVCRCARASVAFTCVCVCGSPGRPCASGAACSAKVGDDVSLSGVNRAGMGGEMDSQVERSVVASIPSDAGEVFSMDPALESWKGVLRPWPEWSGGQGAGRGSGGCSSKGMVVWRNPTQVGLRGEGVRMTSIPLGDGAGLPLGDGVLGGDSCSVEAGGFLASAADVCSQSGLGLPDTRPPGDTGRSWAGDADSTGDGSEESRLAAGERPRRPAVSTDLGVSRGGGVRL